MPEAVDSSSTPVSAGQRFQAVVFNTDLDAFSDTVDQLTALTDMLGSWIHDYGQRKQSAPIAGLFRTLAGDLGFHLEAVTTDLERARSIAADAANLQDGQQIRSGLVDKLKPIVVAVLHEGSGNIRAIDPETVAREYADKIIERIGNEIDALEAGSLLPWAEMAIRRELGSDNGYAATILRDQLIAEQAAAGISPGQLSQAFNLRRDAIERIIGRLRASSSPLEQTG
jgi:hypothetical protein